MTVGFLPTVEESRRLRDEGITRSYEAVAETWVFRAVDIIDDLVERRLPFSANDVWQAGLERPDNARALAGVLKDFQRCGLIAASGQRVRSRWGHGQEITVWQPT